MKNLKDKFIVRADTKLTARQSIDVDFKADKEGRTRAAMLRILIIKGMEQCDDLQNAIAKTK